jgi:hypothetical protein
MHLFDKKKFLHSWLSIWKTIEMVNQSMSSDKYPMIPRFQTTKINNTSISRSNVPVDNSL